MTKEDEYSHAISFLPLIGIVIWKLCCYFCTPVFVEALVGDLKKSAG